MIYLTLINTIAILFLIGIKLPYYLSIEKETTFFNKTLLGYRLYLWRRTCRNGGSSICSIYFKLRGNKTEMKEEAQRMIDSYSNHNKLQSLTAKFSWLSTWEEVREFEKYYSCVDQRIVENLVANFKPR